LEYKIRLKGKKMNICKIEVKIFRTLRKIMPQQWASWIADKTGNGLMKMTR